MTLDKNYTTSWVLLLLSTFFGQNTVLFVPCPGQTNAFTVILNVIEQTDIYQHFKYGTILVLEDWT